MSGGDESTDSNFYKVHPYIKLYKYGVAQPGKCIYQSIVIIIIIIIIIYYRRALYNKRKKSFILVGH